MNGGDISLIGQSLRESAWIVLTAFIFLSWWRFFIKRTSQTFSLSERVLGAFIASVCQIVGSIYLLSWMRILFFWQLGIINAVFSAGLFISTFRFPEKRDIGDEIIAITASFRSIAKSSTAVAALSILAVVVSGWMIYLGQLLPPFCWDAWSYHLPWAAFARQEGHLGPFNQPWLWINIFPKNADILFLWWIIGTNTDRWVNIAQAPFAFASALACFLLMKRIGVRRIDAAASSLLVFSVPTVVQMMWMEMADLVVMGGTLVSLAFLSRKKLDPSSLVLAGCAAGIMIGSKGNGIYFLIGLIIFLLWRLLPLGGDALPGTAKKRIRFALAALGIFALMTFIFGSYFYLRNWTVYGNPTGDYRVQIGKLVLFDGSRSMEDEHFSRNLLTPDLYDALRKGSEWAIVFDGFFDPQKGFNQENRIGGWGAPWTILMLPAVPIAFIWALLRKRYMLAGYFIALLVPYFLFTANHTWTRYHLPVIAVGIISFGYMLSAFKNSPVRRFLLALAIFFMIAASFVGTLHNVLQPEIIGQARKHPYLRSDRYAYFSAWMDRGFAHALESVQAPGSILAFTNMPPEEKFLLLWNSTYSNRVIWVPMDDKNDWIGKIKASGADAVYIDPGGPISYAESHPESFTQIYRGSMGGVYKIR